VTAKHSGNHSPLLSADLQDSIHAMLEQNRLWYDLPPAVDPLYRDYRRDAFVSMVRVGWPLIIIMVGLIILGGWLMFRPLIAGMDGYLWWSFNAISLGIYAIMLPGCHVPAIQRRYIFWVSGFSVLLIANILCAAMLIQNARFAQVVTYIAMITDFGVMLAWSLPPAVAALVCMSGFAVAIGVVELMGVIPDWSIVLTYHVGAVICLFLVALVLERAERIGFLQSRLLAHEAELRVQLNEKLDHQNHQLERLAHQDALTGLANRRQFDRLLVREWDRLKREKKPLALLFIDVDYFKLYNDHYGHAGGDDVLAAVGALLRLATQRPADMAARYGGEEFVVLLPLTSSIGAQEVAQRIIDSIDELGLPHARSQICDHVTVSIGYAATVPHPHSSPQHLLKAADEALYTAKAVGRHCARPAPRQEALVLV